MVDINLPSDFDIIGVDNHTMPDWPTYTDDKKQLFDIS